MLSFLPAYGFSVSPRSKVMKQKFTLLSWAVQPLILQYFTLSTMCRSITVLLADIKACLPRVIYKTHALNSCTPEGYTRHSFRQINILLFSIVLLNADCCLVGKISMTLPIMLHSALFWSLKIFIRGKHFTTQDWQMDVSKENASPGQAFNIIINFDLPSFFKWPALGHGAGGGLFNFSGRGWIEVLQLRRYSMRK